MTQHARKDERFEIRMTAQDKRLVAEAAKLKGMNPSEFALKAALAASRKAISRIQTIKLSQRDQIAMADALLNPPSPNTALRKAMARYRKMVVHD